MTRLYATIELEIMDFVQRCQNLTYSMIQLSGESSIECLTNTSFDTFSSVIQNLNTFIDCLSSYKSDMSIEYEQIITIVSDCSSIVNCVNNYQSLFIEYALDAYLYLDEQCDLIYQKVVQMLYHIYNLPIINSEIFQLEKQLVFYLPLNYVNCLPSMSLTRQITATLIDETSQLFLSNSSLLNNQDEDSNDCIIPSSFLFSALPISITIDNDDARKDRNDHSSYSRSLLQLDKINIHTSMPRHSPHPFSFQYNFDDFEQIEKDLHDKSHWLKIERELLQNIISIWSNEKSSIRTIHPWPSETFWKLMMYLKHLGMNLKSKFMLLLQWCLCFVTIQAFDGDWDVFFSKTLIHTIMTNRWATVHYCHAIHLSTVGHYLNQMFLRLMRITSILQYMKFLSTEAFDTMSFQTVLSSATTHLTKQIEQTFYLLITWLSQHAETLVNSNAPERALIICNNDQIQISLTINYLIESLKQSNDFEQTIDIINRLHLSCDKIVIDTMAKLYRSIESNTVQQFDAVIPLNMDINTTTSCMTLVCNKILKPMLIQCEYLNIDKKPTIYEQILSSFVHAWTSVICQRKYILCDTTSNYILAEYEDLQKFLLTNVPDEDIIECLNKSLAVQEISSVIDSLKRGSSHYGANNSSLTNIPDHEKWFTKRKSSTRPSQFIRYICCCQRQNRVTTATIRNDLD